MASTARLDELKKKFDENPRRYFAPLANEHRKSGDLDQAIALCRSHLPQQPAHISGHIVLAQALYEAGSLDEAREIFHTALGLDPENLIALRYLGDIARDANDVETARSWYQRVLEVDPRNEEIVQIVRDLDLPRAEPSEAEAAPSVPVAHAPAVTPAASAAPAEDDARFALIPIESLELDETLDASSSQTGAGARSESSGGDATLDVHDEWSVEAPTMELPTLDTPGVDPFDMHSAGSAESLLDVSAAAPADDFFLAELSGSVNHDESLQLDAAEASAAESWVPSEPEAVAPPVNAEADSQFEESSFYLEPAPAAPADAPDAEATTEPETLDSSMFDLPETPQHEVVAAEGTGGAFVGSVESTSEPHAEPVMEAFPVEPAAAEMMVDVAELAAQPTAEWQALEPASATPSAPNDLGLEVMEFVPPASDSTPSIIDAATDVDPLLGHMPEMAPTSHGATPTAFVTETMAELYLQQGFRTEALAVYRELLARNPSDANLRERVASIESGSMSSLGMANVSETVVESALRRQSARPAKSVRSFFASLAGRRAPMPAPSSVTESEPATEMGYGAPDATLDAEPAVAAESSFEQPAPAAEAPDVDEVAPMTSAAETLASFDPFADPGDPVDSPAPDAAPAESPESVFGLERLAPLPNAEPVVAPPADPIEPVASLDSPARRSLEDLFPDTPVTPRTEAAAQTLATAFGRGEPQGRPTRAASSELSLDKVFRGAPEGATQADGGFSFDQFFSDARPAGADVAAPAMSPPDTGRNTGPAGDAHDIEQFTAWLEGLKKK